MPGPQRRAPGIARVTRSAQRRAFHFQLFLHEGQARKHHRVPWRRAGELPQRQTPLFFARLLLNLALPVFLMAASSSKSPPIFRSGENCRHFNFNILQDIALEARKGRRESRPPIKGMIVSGSCPCTSVSFRSDLPWRTSGIIGTRFFASAACAQND
jgi:hypothetical protein